MTTGGRGWCRGILGLLVMFVVTASEVYEEPAIVGDVFYEEDVDLDTVLTAENQVIPQKTKIPSEILYKIIKALQKPKFRSNISSEENDNTEDNDWQTISKTLQMKGSVIKRVPGYGSAYITYKAQNQPTRQLKWKTKKGKTVGSQMVCYFKLCAFRSPT